MMISFFETKEDEKQKLQSAFPKQDLQFFTQPIQEIPIEQFNKSTIISTFIYSKITTELLASLPNVKLITTRSTGTDHLPLSYCKEKNITVKNVPLYGENTVAEHTFSLILSLSRKIRKSYQRVLDGSFSTEGLQGFDLKGKTIGLIGGGRIGMHVARMARSFGMHVRVYDIHQDDFLAEILNFKYLDFDSLLKQSDILSLHLPYNPHTHHIINKDAFCKMKDGVILINTARGGLIDTPELILALNAGKLSGAGLDVLEGEEFLLETPLSSSMNQANPVISHSQQLLDNENVVITPHNAFNSIEATNRILEKTIQNIQEELKD